VGALKATAEAIRDQMDVLEAPATLLRMNKPDGFDCPGCAWPDKEHTSTFQFCENGAKAVTWETTSKRVTPEFFAKHTVPTRRGRRCRLAPRRRGKAERVAIFGVVGAGDAAAVRGAATAGVRP
jgi:hypothetical protein